MTTHLEGVDRVLRQEVGTIRGEGRPIRADFLDHPLLP